MLKDWEKFGVLEFDCEEPRVAPLYKNCKPENAFCLIWHFFATYQQRCPRCS